MAGAAAYRRQREYRGPRTSRLKRPEKIGTENERLRRLTPCTRGCDRLGWRPFHAPAGPLARFALEPTKSPGFGP